jgi:hypothetical protein
MKQGKLTVILKFCLALQILYPGLVASNHAFAGSTEVTVPAPRQEVPETADSDTSFFSRHKKLLCIAAIGTSVAAGLATGIYFIVKALTDDKGSSSTAGKSADCSFALASTYADEDGGGEVSRRMAQVMASGTALLSLVGNLLLTNTATSSQQVVENWQVDINRSSWQVASSKKLVGLALGTYDLSFLFNQSASEQYGADGRLSIDVNDTQSITLTLRPIIGRHFSTHFFPNTSARLVARFSAGGVSTAQIASPLIALLLDGNSASHFSLNPHSEETEYYLNVDEGQHSLQLSLYDGDVLKAKTDLGNSTLTISPGQQFNFSLLSYNAMLYFQALAHGTSGKFKFEIPGEIIEQMGSDIPLGVVFTISGLRNGDINTSQVLTLKNKSSQIESADFTLKDLEQENVSWAVSFYNNAKSPPRGLGICGDTLRIDASNKAAVCQLHVFALAKVGTNTLGIIGVNVFEVMPQGQVRPISGALLTMDNGTEVLAQTGNATGFNLGFARLFLPPGWHRIFAFKGRLNGSTALSVSANSASNIDIMVEH